jgi:serine/threonine-protein kinase RsbW
MSPARSQGSRTVRLASLVDHDQGDRIRLSVPATAAAARITRVGAAGLATRAGFTYHEVEQVRLAVGEATALLALGLNTEAQDGTLHVDYTIDRVGLRIDLYVEDRRAPPEPVTDLAAAVLDASVDSWEAWPDLRRVVLHKRHGDRDDDDQ